MDLAVSSDWEFILLRFCNSIIIFNFSSYPHPRAHMGIPGRDLQHRPTVQPVPAPGRGLLRHRSPAWHAQLGESWWCVQQCRSQCFHPVLQGCSWLLDILAEDMYVDMLHFESINHSVYFYVVLYRFLFISQGSCKHPEKYIHIRSICA